MAKGYVGVFALLATLVGGAALADENGQTGGYHVHYYVSGSTFLKLGRNQQAVIAASVYDGVIITGDALNQPASTRWSACTEGWTAEQIADAMIIWLADHPEGLKGSIAVAFVGGVDQACKALDK
ncbi:MAG: hypothetical protein WBG82_12400 [Parvibaculum sp.]|uniref:hypothetical protein n=1 Tax=Parvibaculum sp. TaxID=2024848 RepID=UPI003C78AF54